MEELSRNGDGKTNDKHGAISKDGIYLNADLLGYGTSERAKKATLYVHIPEVPVLANNTTPYFRVWTTSGEFSNTCNIDENTAQKAGHIGNIMFSETGYHSINITNYMNECIASGKRTMTLLLDVYYTSAIAYISSRSSEYPAYIVFEEDTDPLLIRPEDKYVSMQNPPDFMWGNIAGAKSYDIKICTDQSLNNVVYEKKGITNNFYNFNQPFETGVDFYWAVRYNFSETSGRWSNVRRFRIDPKASEFTVPDFSGLASKVSNGHPRVFTTPDKLSDFRAIKDKNSLASSVYSQYVSKAREYMLADNLPAEPAIKYQSYWNTLTDTYKTGQYSAYLAGQGAVKEISSDMLTQMYTAGVAYLLSGDVEIGAFAKKALLQAANWNISGVSSYPFDDQIHREFVYRSAMVYDWVYNLLSDTEKQTILNMIKARVTHVYKNGSCLGNLMTSIAESPLDSHGWTAIGYLGITAYALINDLPEASEWFEKIVPLYTARMHPWSNQDGGWSQGTDYWRYSTISSKEFMDVLALGNVINLYDKAWSINEKLWVLYAYPNGSVGSFGDQSGAAFASSMSQNREAMAALAHFTDDAVARWIVKDLGGMGDTFSAYYTSENYYNGEVKEPSEYPLAHNFKDIDWAVMTDSIKDRDRIQFTFKSSPYGSFNHSHADQNSFVIQSNGSEYTSWLAGKGGYYDYYHSVHDKNIARQSFSHNTITVDGGQGQVDDSLDAKGNIPLFVNHLEFDTTTGEAAKAYGGKLDKFDRNIIYIRPDVFIVVDDLDAAGDGESSFEWWLNSGSDMEYTNNSVITQQGSGRLKVDVKYPKNTTATYYTEFKSPIDGQIYAPTGSYANSPIHKKISFVTEKTAKTKMIVSMSVYDTNSKAKVPETEYFDTYVKMTYENGTVVLVSLMDNDETVETADGISFKGAAVSYTDSSIMLINGTYLEKDDDVLIDADRAISAAIGMGQICLSSDDDFEINLNSMNDYLVVTDADGITDRDGRSLSSAIGITAEKEEKTLKLAAQKGNYTLTYEIAKPSLEFTELSMDGDGSNPAQTQHRMTRDVGTYFKVDLSGFKTTDRLENVKLKIYVTGPANVSNANANTGIYVYKTTGDLGTSYTIAGNSAAKGAEIGVIAGGSVGYCEDFDITSYTNECIASGQGYMVLLLQSANGSAITYISSKGNANPPSITYELAKPSLEFTELSMDGDGSNPAQTQHRMTRDVGTYFKVDLSGFKTTDKLKNVKLKIYVTGPANVSNANANTGIYVYKTTGDLGTSYTIAGNSAAKGAEIGVIAGGSVGYCEDFDITAYTNECIASGQGYMVLLLQSANGSAITYISSKGNVNPPSIMYESVKKVEGEVSVSTPVITSGTVTEGEAQVTKQIATATVNNASFDDEDGVIIIAAYVGEGLESAALAEFSVPCDDEQDVSVNINPVEGATYKAFVWNKNLSPYTFSE